MSQTKLLESIDDCADRLEHLQKTFPKLSSEELRLSVERWRSMRVSGRIEIAPRVERPTADVELIAEADKTTPDESREFFRRIAIKLLESNGLEDTQDILRAEHGVDLTLKNLIVLVGKGNYLKALKQDAKMLHANAISYEQIAELWNDLERPAFGGKHWSARSISMLFQ